MPSNGPSSVGKMHADEVDVDDDLVRALLVSQFPRWADLALERMPSTGTDNAIYRLGHDFGVRMPRIHWAVKQIAKEYEWLPRLGPQLPVSLPQPVARGEPAHGYPFPWLVFRWLEGRDAMVAAVDDWCRLATDVARFVLALQAVEANDGPPALGRGGPLVAYDVRTRHAIDRLDGEIDVDHALA